MEKPKVPNGKKEAATRLAAAKAPAVAKTPALAKTPAPAPVIAHVPPLFRTTDWVTFAVTFAAVWIGYYLTLAPEQTLEDSGELARGPGRGHRCRTGRGSAGFVGLTRQQPFGGRHRRPQSHGWPLGKRHLHGFGVRRRYAHRLQRVHVEPIRHCRGLCL